jgi:FAD/FMN-containing dehydrogenase
MLTDWDKIEVLNDKISGIESYMIELKSSLAKNEIQEDQIGRMNEVILQEEQALAIFKALLRQIDPNAII